MRYALLQLIKQQESSVEMEIKEFMGEIEQVQQHIDILMGKIEDHDTDLRLRVQEAYTNVIRYHQERKTIMDQLTRDMGVSKC